MAIIKLENRSIIFEKCARNYPLNATTRLPEIQNFWMIARNKILDNFILLHGNLQHLLTELQFLSFCPTMCHYRTCRDSNRLCRCCAQALNRTIRSMIDLFCFGARRGERSNTPECNISIPRACRLARSRWSCFMHSLALVGRSVGRFLDRDNLGWPCAVETRGCSEDPRLRLAHAGDSDHLLSSVDLNLD